MTSTASDRPQRVRDRRPAPERLKQIITEATTLIAERGFWGISIQDVADACGISDAGVLHHVGTKEGLLVAVLEHRDEVDIALLSQMLGIAESELKADGTLSVSLRDFCRALVARNAQQPEIVRLYSVLNAESLDPQHPAYAYFSAREVWATALFAAAAAGTANPARIARQVFAAMDGLQLRWLRNPAIDLVAEWDALAESIVRPYEMH
ncbi:TetR/AcrR family transcriptional regulator [Cryobacterium glucosi]|uniref:TetR/AcrR family transcriptional regulator n=1 Tax=Cryobacterium glucosi TaxID=1259175 RepID=A0ABY2ILQ1_9MICO|nr:TetR/AcrR family transcriptional regulator [Cryobacterium glucosi]TFC20342.1 TetR/AcrR family transcriptional regulator [Cryobacterium glucosi]